MMGIIGIGLEITTTDEKKYRLENNQNGYWLISSGSKELDSVASEHVGGYLAAIGAVKAPYMDKFMHVAVALGGDAPEEPDWMGKWSDKE